MKALYKTVQEVSGEVFWTQIDECVFQMCAPDESPIRKPWLTFNNDREFHERCRRLCPGDHQHCEDGMLGMGSSLLIFSYLFSSLLFSSLLLIFSYLFLSLLISFLFLLISSYVSLLINLGLSLFRILLEFVCFLWLDCAWLYLSY